MSQTYSGPYAHIKFPGYVFKEYPKWIKGPLGKPIIVKNQQEEVQNQFETINGIELPADPLVRERDALAGQVAILKQENAAKDLMFQEMQAQIKTLQGAAGKDAGKPLAIAKDTK